MGACYAQIKIPNSKFCIASCNELLCHFPDDDAGCYADVKGVLGAELRYLEATVSKEIGRASCRERVFVHV